MSALSVKPIPTLIHYTRSFEYMMVMKLQSVKLIPTRNWRNKNFDLVVERDKNRKKSQQRVDTNTLYVVQLPQVMSQFGGNKLLC